MRKDVTQLYLDRYAEPEIALAAQVHTHFGHALIIPAYDERPEFFSKTLRSIPKGSLGDVLLILVVNAPDTAPAEKLASNQHLVDSLRTQCEGTLPLLKLGQLSILLVDRFSAHPIPKAQGVGLARKIGCDIALQLWHSGQIRSPWLHCTDADANLPTDYFSAATQIDPRRHSAIAYPFWHAPSEDDASLNQAIALYETKLRLFRLGFLTAGSPYAYHSIGSTLTAHAPDYARVRGFPARAAAEDFYLLNKLAKLNPVATGQGGAITLRARRSMRAPFGTGPMLERLLAADANAAKLYEHPETFRHLGAWLQAARAFALEPHRPLEDHFRDHASTQQAAPLLFDSLTQMGALASLTMLAKQYPSPRARLAAFHTWFDGFRSIKLLHALQNQAFGLLSFEELKEFHADIDDVEAFRFRLAGAEK